VGPHNPALSRPAFGGGEAVRNLPILALVKVFRIGRVGGQLTPSLGSFVGWAQIRCIMFGMNKTPVMLQDVLTRLKAMLPLLREMYHVRTLEVFGSYVRGEEGTESDLDLLVTFEEVPTLFQFVALENFLSDDLGVKVDLVMKDSLKPAIGKYILEEAQKI